ncbi:glycosyl hydrolase family 61-domain-containing protein [Stachybotrys elegans]|uniref:lytic cellulose monooxygenase (C4-dehydrogenating) n=1 Tax=Stachybotrys elegans TaxID=80388 RepID=A0A8K0WUJ3_9HYPO|nr:glycosyl hydrolase family 61-domain-containing protein [Stachybotrys elegans]
MRQSSLSAAAILGLTGVHHVRAHSHVTNIVVNGASYDGFNTKEDTNPDILAAWSTDVGPEDGWVGLEDYQSPDIICHVNGTNAKGYVTVEAGDRISFQWLGWPESHHGPALTYLAYCGDASDSCVEVDKRELEFFKIGRGGLLNATEKATDFSSGMGIWATDELIAKNHTWMIEVPKVLSPGFYVMRHELIALHYAMEPTLGPQHYPQCFNIEVRGTGTQRPDGIPATELYTWGHPGLEYDIFVETLAPYTIPGPTLVTGAVGMPEQTSSTIESHVSAEPAEPTRMIRRPRQSRSNV